MLIQEHLCSRLQPPMISFISLQPSTLQHSGLHRGHYQSISHKKGDERKHIFRKCCSVQSCGKLVLLRFLILGCSASLCHCTSLIDFDGGKRKDEARISLMLLINKRQRRETCYLVLDVMRPFTTSSAVNYLWRFAISPRNGQGTHLLSCSMHGH